jgi:hypothetical protein
MVAKNNTIILVALALVGSVCAMTCEVWGIIIAIITLIFIVAITFFGNRWGRKLYRKVMLPKPFEVFYVGQMGQSNDKQMDSCIIKASPQSQNLRFELLMRNELKVRFVEIRFRFSGKQTRPTISGLCDWNRQDAKLPSNVEAYPMQNGNWFWNYFSANERSVGSKITIGIECQAMTAFDGVLEFGLTAIEVAKTMSMPFIVKVETEGTHYR